MASEPQTLQEVILYFSDPSNCREYVVARRWPNGVVCPRCGSTKVAFLEKYNRWQCGARHPRRQFTLKTGTIFEDSPLGMDKWLTAMWLVVTCKNGVSSYEIHRGIGVTQKTAWFMDHRIRLALRNGSFEKLSGHIEADETFIGGKARNMHAGKRAKVIKGRGPEGKTIVAAVLNRHGEVRATVVGYRRKWQLQNFIMDNVAEGSEIHTDALQSYAGLDKRFVHKVIDHAEAYVKDNVHTNGLENFWSLLKRSINGTYISVEPFHLFRYIDEQSYRYNNRNVKDADRFSKAVASVTDRRLTYKELTGKTGSAVVD